MVAISASEQSYAARQWATKRAQALKKAEQLREKARQDRLRAAAAAEAPEEALVVDHKRDWNDRGAATGASAAPHAPVEPPSKPAGTHAPLGADAPAADLGYSAEPEVVSDDAWLESLRGNEAPPRGGERAPCRQSVPRISPRPTARPPSSRIARARPQQGGAPRGRSPIRTAAAAAAAANGGRRHSTAAAARRRPAAAARAARGRCRGGQPAASRALAGAYGGRPRPTYDGRVSCKLGVEHAAMGEPAAEYAPAPPASFVLVGGAKQRCRPAALAVVTRGGIRGGGTGWARGGGWRGWGEEAEAEAEEGEAEAEEYYSPDGHQQEQEEDDEFSSARESPVESAVAAEVAAGPQAGPAPLVKLPFPLTPPPKPNAQSSIQPHAAEPELFERPMPPPANPLNALAAVHPPLGGPSALPKPNGRRLSVVGGGGWVGAAFGRREPTAY